MLAKTEIDLGQLKTIIWTSRNLAFSAHSVLGRVADHLQDVAFSPTLRQT